MRFNNEKPIYLQIAEYIIEKILTKEWSEQQRIPSVRELATQIEVNPNTIAKTFSYLEQNDIIFKERGLGYYVAAESRMNIIMLRKKELSPFAYLNSSGK